MGHIPASMRDQVGRRDGYRCQECGIRVGRIAGRAPGLQFHAHHKVPESRGGKATLDNLVTLCSICHATKASRGHRLLFSRLAKNNLGDFVVWFLRDAIGIESFAYSETLDPSEIPSEEVCDVLKTIANLCDRLAADIQASPPMNGPKYSPPSLAELLPGLDIGWKAHLTEHHLQELLHSERSSNP